MGIDFSKAGKFTHALFKHATNNFHVLSEDKKQERLNICSSCEFFLEKDRVCGQCGCYLDIKASWESEECPIGKWPRHQSINATFGSALVAHSGVQPIEYRCGGCGGS